MSDNFIILIPESPGYVPCPEAQRQAIALLQKLAPAADEVKAETSDEVRFIDCGENFERVICPECAKGIELEWWQQHMSDDYASGFQLRPVTLPCCGKKKSLAELTYDWPQGFARFSLEAMNPGIADLSEDRMREFEGILGCRVRKVLQHL